MKDCYVVTGGAGFIGSHIAERLPKMGTASVSSIIYSPASWKTSLI